MQTTLKQQGKLSHMAENLKGSEIIELGGIIKQKIASGENIFNYTIGDFNPKIFSIPQGLKSRIVQAYEQDMTNYPAANGIPELRTSVSNYIKDVQGLDYSADEFLVSGGARPLIYATYSAIVDPNEKVLFPVPSWNNNHYTHIHAGQQVLIETKPENNFMPTADDLKFAIKEVSLVALCSPLNPTGTVFSKEQLSSICELIIEENKRRAENDEKPVYLLYDQIYWQLVFGDVKHEDPVSLYPEMIPYTVFIDGISKCYAATGVRVGWAFGPKEIISKMKSILGHVGAWAPRAEQMATAQFLEERKESNTFLTDIKSKIYDRLQGFYTVFQGLKEKGYPVDAIAPQAAMYLTVKVNLKGYKTDQGLVLETTKDVTNFLLSEAKLAMVPFYAFGTDKESTWFRLSVGTAKMEDIEEISHKLEKSFLTLQKI
jgi:aspartate aminotransferase